MRKKTTSVPEFLSGGGEMGQRIREYDWSQTSLGPIDTWPQSLRTCIRIMLTSRQPIWIGWGKDLLKFYNDPYKAIVGGKHPWALGKPASVVWKDIWNDIEPMLKQVMEKDEGTYVESQLLIMERNGYPEETYYTFSYTPIPGDDGKTEGMFCANTDDTDKNISERQLRTLTQLGKRLSDCRNNKDIIEKTITTLEENPYDFPFAIFRTIEEDKATLVHSTPLGEAATLVSKTVQLNEPTEVAGIVKKTIATHKPQLFEELIKKVGIMPKGAWATSPDKAMLLPIMQTGMKKPYGVLIVGMNPYRLLDEKYSSFFSLVADQIATSFADVHRLEEERKRAEALAEIDRAKTTFFSNISHEFRTPLTLLLGPVEDALNDPSTAPENKIRMDVAYRNALRMQKLVNTLLEFSRIEAGRMEGHFSPVDICSFTQELSSTFRSAIEKAGMKLEVICEEIKNEVYVDVDMWEKIVLNLISNAFKYSRQGTITIAIKENNNTIQLLVADTGIGIPHDQLNKIFDRFHRVENIQGRSQEGTGIGLAMVKELVRLHQGTITVESQLGKGSTFIVTIPSGKEHLPEEKITNASASISKSASAFVQEAMKWTAEENNIEENVLYKADINTTPNEKKFKILVADDNADMREYVKRLLSGRFQVLTATYGEEAYNKVLHHHPDLLLSDIMMPRMDGFALLQKIRNHPDYKSMPVILLSARAGEEAKVEGLDAGADDYLVKPFSARELLAKISSQVKINNLRNNALQSIYNLFYEVPFAVAVLKGKALNIEFVNQYNLNIWQRKKEEVLGKPLFEVFPGNRAGAQPIHDEVYRTGQRFIANEVEIELLKNGKLESHYFNATIDPLKDINGEIIGQIATSIEVTEFVLARKKTEESEARFRQLANAVPQLVWVANSNGDITYYNDRIAEFEGALPTTEGVWEWKGMVHKDDWKSTEEAWNYAIKYQTIYQIEHRFKLKSDGYHWFLSRGYPYKNEEGKIEKWFGTTTDIHASKEQSAILEEQVKKRTKELNDLNFSLQQSNNELQQFAHVASHDLKEPVRKIKTFVSRLIEENSISASENGNVYLKKINSAADRMNIMIEGVLNYSMLNAAHQKAEKVNLNEVIKNIEADLEVLITQKSATIQYSDLPSVEGASVLLYQLFYNLINNSLKFSKAHQPSVITISSSVFLRNDKEFAEIRIRDNGIGFEQAFADKIFETFLRLNSKDQFEGTGLGLSLCQRIAERHGGTIEAFGEPDKGSEFVILLPVKQGEKAI